MLAGLLGVLISPLFFNPLSQLVQAWGPAWAKMKLARVHHIAFWLLSLIWAGYFGVWVWKVDRGWFGRGDLTRKFFLVLAAGSLLRLAVILFSHAPQVSDARDYDQLAVSLAQTGTFEDQGAITAYRPVGYVAFLAALYRVFGHSLALAKLANLVLGVLTLFFLWRIFSRWKDGPTALKAVAVTAFYLPEIYSTQFLLSEPLFGLLWVVSIYLWGRNREEKWNSLAAGALLGLSALVRPVVLLWAALPVWEAAARKQLARLFLFVLALGLVTSPWFYRNHEKFGVWVLSTHSGINFWMGANPQATGYYHLPDTLPFNFKNEGELERTAWKLGWNYVKSHPFEYLRLGLVKEAVVFGFDYSFALTGLASQPPYGRLLWAILGEAMWWIILFFAAVKAVPLWFNPKNKAQLGSSIPLWTLAYWAVVHFFFVGTDRFHHPVVPFFAYLAALGLSTQDKLNQNGAAEWQTPIALHPGPENPKL